jgi:hypothetical protein|tara:strand:- start:754 stop:972 length:219 start_codon:yes stop_codon:yes gene_type:complete
MLVPPEKREAYLRTKSRFYIAGWVAAEGNEAPQKKPERGALNWEHYYADYQTGYGDQIANSECMSMGGKNVG